MRLSGIVLCLLLLPAACQRQPATMPSATPAYSSADCPAGDHQEEIASGGQVRQYVLHVPSAYRPETPMPLVLGFHGAGSNARQFESYSNFSFIANVEGFIVVYPQALGQHPTWDTVTGPGNPDIEFVAALMDDLQRRCNIDPDRIYATGHSNGGGMANRLACDLADRIAAIGTVSGAYQGAEDCSPARPVAVLGIHGTDDLIIPYNGFQGVREPPAAHYVIGTPIPQWASSWATRDGCDKSPVSTRQSERVTRDQWSHCRSNADVILYTIHGGGHGWTDAFDAAQVIWDFFAGHPLVK
jgi:polyhydroxybutyrate depolymerase